MVISLTGFMGCGKSSIGRELATLLNCPTVDLDEVIQRRAGHGISEIFESDGEAGFRVLELESLREVLGAGDEVTCLRNCKTNNNVEVILSLGGGTLTTPECATLVHEKTICIYLRAGIDTLVENLEEDGIANRPMLNGTYSQKNEHSPIGEEQPPLQENQQQNGGKIHNTALRNRIAELMNARTQSYEKTARFIIDIDGETPRETAQRIVALLK